MGYPVNNPNKKIGTLFGVKADDIIWYFKTDGDKKKKKIGVSINPREMLSGEELKQEMESRNKSKNRYWTW